MIFSIADHIEQIKQHRKTQTRRPSGKYQVGKLYAIQPCRTCKGIPDGKIFIVSKTIEHKRNMKLEEVWLYPISDRDAEAEGGYGRTEYEELYEKMYPNWRIRYRYRFTYYPKEEIAQCQDSSR
jgi:hypothetical protein